MSQFPVNTPEGLYEAVNYLASGPSGLGQNFAGFSSYAPAWLTGNFRIPYSQPTVAQLYVAPIDIDTAEMLDARTIKLTFVTPQATPPFALGNGLSVSGISGSYDQVLGDYGVQIGVVECTTTYVIIRLRSAQPLMAPGSGGTVEYYSTGNFSNSTDCLARVTVTGGTDRVFISAQLDNLISYEVFSASAELTYTVAVVRLIGFLNDDPTNPDYLFNYDATVAEKVYVYPGLTTGTGTLPLVDTIFTTILDQPAPGYYRYEIEVTFNPTSGSSRSDIEVTTSEFKLRSISAQVVKQ